MFRIRSIVRAGIGMTAAIIGGISVAAPRAAQVPSSPPDGQALYASRCATCHENSVPRAVNRTVLGRVSPDNIRYALTVGLMRMQGSRLTTAEREAVVQFLTEGAATELAQTVGRCSTAEPMPARALETPRWNGWGVDPRQTRFQSADMAQLTAARLPSLRLKWAFGFSGVVQAYGQPTVVGGRIFVGSADRKVYALDARTGCQYWVFDAAGPVRAAITIGSRGSSFVAYVADQAANVYALDASNGSLVWKRHVDDFIGATITGAPTLMGSTLYVPASSSEEGLAVSPVYECCRFRGSVTALDVDTGTVRWKSYVIREEPRATRKNARGTQLWGPAGAAIWSSPTVDVRSGRVFVTTGDAYSDPAADTSDAFVAFDAVTGKTVWSRQMTNGDAFTIGCDLPAPYNSNCPAANGPDHDFGSSAILIDLSGGRRALVAGQKSGVVHAVNPDNGAILWQTRLGKGGRAGGVQWGAAWDGTRIYVALSDVAMTPAAENAKGAETTFVGIPLLLDPKAGGGIFALDPVDGHVLWKTPHPGCGEKAGCSPAQSAAVTAIPGVVFSGGLDGHLRAYGASDGRILWDVDTVREYSTVNGVRATGGSLDGPGAVVSGGMLYVNSGYAFVGGMPGNVLLAFSVDGQ